MRRLISRFRPRERMARAGRDERGASAVAFAIAFAVLTPVALGIFDVYQSTEQRGKLQDALDAAALYAARSSASTTESINTVGNRALAANLQLIHGAKLTKSSFTLNGTEVDASAQVSLPAYAPMEYTHLPVTATSTVQRAMDRLEVALVLDNTGSMAQKNKLAILQTDAKKLVDALVAASAQSTDPTPLKIALVPFGATVRVQGTTSLAGANYDAATHSGANIPTWLDPQGVAHHAAGVAFDTFDAQTDRLAMMKNVGQPWNGCVEARMAPYDITEDPTNPAVPATMFVPYFAPDEFGPSSSNNQGFYNSYLDDPGAGNWKVKEQNHLKYAGGSVRGGTNGATGYAYGPNAGCGLQPMIRLTTDTASIKSAIDGMTAIGETNIPMGLVWGWYALSPNGPLHDGSPYGSAHLKKVIILMTDGLNTFNDTGGGANSNQSYYGGLGYAWQGMLAGVSGGSTSAQRTAAMDARLAQLCTNVKARNIYVYTIRVEVASGSTSLLQDCATRADDFYEVTNVANLGAAFSSIAGSINNLRISH